MARPKPEILLEYIDKTHRSEQVISALALYAVYYQDAPINLKTVNVADPASCAKYKKTSFTSLAHCKNLAERLNTQFKTTDFTVVRVNNDRQKHL